MISYTYMDDNQRYSAQSFAGQTSRNAGRMLGAGIVQAFKVLFRFAQEMFRMFLGK
jgi:hypothetical protein